VSDSVPVVDELVPPPDPLDTCARLAGLPFLVFLDSAIEDERLGRYSFLTADPPALIRSRRTGDPLVAARRLLARHALAPVPDLPPFQGGVAGYVGYDWGAALERVPRARYRDCAAPDVMLGLYDWTIAWDHAARRCWIISTGLPARGAGRV